MPSIFDRLYRSKTNIKIKPYFPTITKKDLNRGVLYRYFVSRSNHTKQNVFEVSKRDFDRHSKNPTLVCEAVRWLIKGPIDDVKKIVYIGDEPEEIMIPGVRTQNRGAIKIAAERIPILRDYLTPLQYYIGE